MSMAQQYASYLERESHKAETPVKAEALRQAAKKMYELEQERNNMADEIQRLQNALFFWLPNIPSIENECTDRMAEDAALLIGHEGRTDDTAEQRGWVVLTPND